MKYVLETSRLHLREMTLDDLEFVASMVGHEEVMRFYPQDYSRTDAEQWIQRSLLRYARDGHGHWLVLRKDTNQPVGMIGLIEMLVEGTYLSEVGYLLHRPFWKQGFASEAALGVRDHAFGVLDRPFVVSQIRPINSPSQAVARKLGMRPTKLNLHGGLEHVLWRVDREGRG